MIYISCFSRYQKKFRECLLTLLSEFFWNNEKFVVCYPQGTSDSFGDNFWNVGYEFHNNQMVNDVNFLSSLANYLQNEYNLSEENII